MTVVHIAHRREIDGAIQSLDEHLLQVADIAKSLAAKIGLNEQGELLGLLHDLGKYSGEFQNYLQSAVGLINPDEDEYVDARGLKGKVDHSTAGAQLVWAELSKQGDMGRIVGQICGLCIASHHSGLIDCLSSVANHPVKDVFTERISKQDSRTHLVEAESKTDALVDKRVRELVGSQGLIDGVKKSIRQVMLRNDVKGLDPLKNKITQFKLGLLVRFLFSCLIDADRVDAADFEKPQNAKHRLKGRYTEWPLLIERLEKYLQGLTLKYPEMDEIRRNISDHCREGAARDKGIYTLTVPTGGGKTLSSLRFALHHAERHLDRILLDPDGHRGLVVLVEMEHRGEHTLCCGEGGTRWIG